MENNTNGGLSFLKGKTIGNIEWVPVHTPSHYEEPYDDGDNILITFTDGYTLKLAGNFNADYTGRSKGEYPSYITATISEPKGFNGPGVYEAQSLEATPLSYDEIYCYNLTFKGENLELENPTFRFYANSLEEAKSFLDLEQVEYVKYVNNDGPLGTNTDTSSPSL